MKVASLAAAAGFFAGALFSKGQSPSRAAHVAAESLPWEWNAEVPAARWKTLVGDERAIAEPDVRFGTFELAPHSTYPGHLHPAPELYFVVSGSAEWTVGVETFDAGPGTTIVTPPNAVHRMINRSEEPLRAVWAWWAPGGDRSVFEGGYRLVEPAEP